MKPMLTQPQIMTAGPPVFRPKPNRVMPPARMQITLKLIAKLPNPPILRASSG